MKKNEIYASIVEKAYAIAKENFITTESLKKLEEDKNALLNDLKHNSFIKVPFVGDFSAGKSSLLNAMMGVDVLPTDVVPTTAVSYELYYSEKEYLEIYHKGQLKEMAELSQISELKVVPGDVVYVYLKNQFVKRWNERGIVLVDMPGIDSGIEEHNNAIMNYIQEGSYFFLVTPAEQGTLRSSTLQFVDELKKYNLQCSVVISKIDQKPESEIEKIKTDIEAMARRVIREDIDVVVSSSAVEQFGEVVSLLEKLDPEKFIVGRFEKLVSAYISGVIDEIQLQIRLALSDKKDFSEKIAAINAEREKALNEIAKENDSAQSLEGSADDILKDVQEALISKSQYLATLLYNNNNDNTVLNAELLSIIRPVLINSFKRELTEYQDVISDSVKEFSLNVNEILQDGDNKLLNYANDLVGNLLGKEALETVLKKGLDKMIMKLAAYKGLSTLLKSMSKILGPIVVIVVNIVPDLLRMIFGKSKEQKIESIRQKIVSEVSVKVVEALREPVSQLLEEQRKEVVANMSAMIERESAKYDENIKAVQAEQQENDQATAARIEKLQAAVDRLNNLNTEM